MNYRKPANPKIQELTEAIKERKFNLSDIPQPKTDDGTKVCCWCMSILDGKKRRWCSNECITAAMAWAYPQKEQSIYLLLYRQNMTCNSCLYDYGPCLREAEISKKHRTSSIPQHKFIQRVIRRVKARVPDANRIEIDHVVPVVLGGTTLGQDNVQILCRACHKEKSKIDMKERDRVKGNPRKGVKFSESHSEVLSKVRKGKDTEARKAGREKNLYPALRIPITAINIKTGEQLNFDSVKECCDTLKLSGSCVTRALVGVQNRTQHKGWTFRFR